MASAETKTWNMCQVGVIVPQFQIGSASNTVCYWILILPGAASPDLSSKSTKFGPTVKGE